MTISTQSNKIVYEGNGSTTLWSFSFPGGPDPDILVLTTAPGGMPTQLTTNFQVNVNPSIAPNPTSIGGTVQYPVTGSPLPVGWKITIVRFVPLTQPTSLSNQATMYQEVIEGALDYLAMQTEQLQERINRRIAVPVDEVGVGSLPSIADRANKFFVFDADGNPAVIGMAAPVTPTNAIRVATGESIPELPAAASRPGQFISFDSAGNPILVSTLPPNVPPLFGAAVTITSTHAVTNAEKGFLFFAEGAACYDITLGSPLSYDADFSVVIKNSDFYSGPGSGRAKRILLDGFAIHGNWLWPGQAIYIFRHGGSWTTNPFSQRWRPSAMPTFYVDPINGNSTGITDGLATGTGAFKDINTAAVVCSSRLDTGQWNPVVGSPIIQLANGFYTAGTVINFPTTVGGQPIIIKGADDGGDASLWELQVPANQSGIMLDLAANVIIKGITFNGVGNDANGINVQGGSSCDINNCRFKGFASSTGIGGSAILAIDTSSVYIRDINIVGGCYVVVQVRRASSALMSGALTVSSGLNFAGAFAVARYNSMIVGGASGGIGDSTDFHLVGGTSCTGRKYYVFDNSVANLGTGVMDTLPGNMAGQTGTTPLHGVDASLVY